MHVSLYPGIALLPVMKSPLSQWFVPCKFFGTSVLHASQFHWFTVIMFPYVLLYVYIACFSLLLVPIAINGRISLSEKYQEVR